MELEELIKKRYDEFRPAVSEQEWELISRDSRLVRHNRIRRWRKVWFWGGVTLLAVAAIVTAVLLKHPKSEDTPANTAQPKFEKVDDNIVEQCTSSTEKVESENVKTNEMKNIVGETEKISGNAPSVVAPVIANNSQPDVAAAPTNAIAPKVAAQPTVASTKKTTPAQHVQSPTPTPKPKVVETVVTNENNPEPDDNPQVEYKLFVPSAFTPNGDGLNDQFQVSANFEPLSFDITIFTKTSEKVFYSRSIDIGWDGTKYGTLLPQGVYLYVIKYTNPEGKVESQKGQILLLK